MRIYHWLITLLLSIGLLTAGMQNAFAVEHRQASDEGAAAKSYLPVVAYQSAPPNITVRVVKVTQQVNAADESAACFDALPQFNPVAAALLGVCPSSGTYTSFTSGAQRVLVGNSNRTTQSAWGGTSGAIVNPTKYVLADAVQDSTLGFYTQTGVLQLDGAYALIEVPLSAATSVQAAAPTGPTVGEHPIADQSDFSQALKGLKDTQSETPMGGIDASVLFFSPDGTSARVLEACTAGESEPWIATGPMYTVPTLLGQRMLYDGIFNSPEVGLCMGVHTAIWVSDLMNQPGFAAQVNSYRQRSANQWNWQLQTSGEFQTIIGWTAGVGGMARMVYEIWRVGSVGLDRQFVKAGMFIVVPAQFDWRCNTQNGRTTCLVTDPGGIPNQ